MTDTLDILTLTTPRLRLRPLVPADAPAFFAIHADPASMVFWSEPAWTDPAQADAVIERDREGLADGTSYRFGLFETVGGLVGCCSLFRIDAAQGRAEMGYILRPSHRGRGLMHEAMSAVIAFAFGPRGLRRLEADLDPRNTASAQVVVRLGFAFEALMRERWLVAGEVSDSAIYGLLRDRTPE